MQPFKLTVEAETPEELVAKLNQAADYFNHMATTVMTETSAPEATGPAPAPTAAETPEKPAEAPAPASTEAVELDKDGLPWDDRIHSSNRKKTANGKWQRRRNVPDVTFNKVADELRALLANTKQDIAPTEATGPAPAPTDEKKALDWTPFLTFLAKKLPVLASWVQLGTLSIDGDSVVLVFASEHKHQFDEVNKAGNVKALSDVIAEHMGREFDLTVGYDEPKEEESTSDADPSNFQELMNYMAEHSIDSKLLDGALSLNGLKAAADLLTDESKVGDVFKSLVSLL